MRKFIIVFVLASLAFGGMGLVDGYTVKAVTQAEYDRLDAEAKKNLDAINKAVEEVTHTTPAERDAEQARQDAEQAERDAEQAERDAEQAREDDKKAMQDAEQRRQDAVRKAEPDRQANLDETKKASKNAAAASQEVGDATQAVVDAQKSGDPDAIEAANERLVNANKNAEAAAAEAERASQKLLENTYYENDPEARSAAEAAQLAAKDASEMAKASREMADKINAAAISKGILPSPLPDTNCDDYVKNNKNAFTSKSAFQEKIGSSKAFRNEILGCALKTGRIRLFMVPYYVVYLIEYMLALAGLIAVLFVVYGGFKYVVGGISEDKESGKKIILHALIGLIVALSAWIVINFVQVALTS